MNRSKFFPEHRPQRNNAWNRPRRLRVEGLEDRRLCALPGIHYEPATGVLTIQGTAAADNVSVGCSDNNIVMVSISQGNPNMPKAKPGPTWNCPGPVTKIEFYGNAGNDTFTNNTNIPCFADGGSGNDTLQGGGANDILFGGTGQDSLYGRGGSDSLYGNGGTDYLDGGDGDDILVGGYDGCVDQCRGGAGHDVFFQYYGAKGVHPQKFLDYQASEDWIQLLAEPGWWSKPGTVNKIPQASGSGSTSDPLL